MPKGVGSGFESYQRPEWRSNDGNWEAKPQRDDSENRSRQSLK